MAVKRAVSTVVAVQGEKEYKAAMQEIQRENKTLVSALKLVEAQYKGNANSMAALEAKGKALKAMLDGQNEAVKRARAGLEYAKTSQDAYAQKTTELKNKIESANQELDALKTTSTDTAAEQQKLTAEIDALNKELLDAEAGQKKSAAAVEIWQKRLNDAQTEVVNLDRKIEKNNRYLDEAKTSADGTAKSIDNMGKEMRGAGDDAKNFGENTKTSLEDVRDVMTALGFTQLLRAISEGFRECVDASVEFESAMAGVAKTTDLSKAELAQMGQQIKELSTEIPITTTEFAGIVEIAGQLGIAKENLVEFATVMANLGVATNLTSEEAATMLAQFANITQMDTTAYSNLGSAVVALGNNFATNERVIVEMTQRIASAGEIAGMTEADMLGLSAAVTSMGIQAENGGTQMSKLISEIQKAVETGDKLDKFASIAGMSAGEFASAWGVDATEALIKFIAGLNDVERNGKSAIVLLKELKLNETRLQTMMLSLAGAGTLLGDAVSKSNDAWAENTALTNEAATRYATTESKVAMMRNAYNNLSIAIGDKLGPVIREGTDLLTKFAEHMQKGIEEGELMVPVMVGAATAVGVLVAAFAAFTIVDKMRKSVEKFMAVVNANPWVLAATAIIAVISAIVTFAAACNEGEYSVKTLTSATREAQKVFKEQDKQLEKNSTDLLATAQMASAYVSQLAELEQKTTLTAAEQAKWNMLLREVTELIPEASKIINLQTGSIEGGTAALLENIEAWVQLGLAQARQEAFKEKFKAFAEVEAEALINLSKRAKKESELLSIGKEMEALQKDITDSTKGLTAAEIEGNKEIQEKNDRYVELVDQYSKVDKEIGNLDKALEKNDKALEENGEELGIHSTVLDDWKARTVTAAEEVNETAGKTQEQIAALEMSLSELQEKYTETYIKALESLDKQYGAFDKIEQKAAVSTKKLIGNLDSQLQFFQTYAENLKKAAELGISDGLIATLSDGSVESAAILQGIVNDNGKSVEDINEKWKGVIGAKDTLAKTMADMQTDFTAKSAAIQAEMDSLVQNMNQEKEAVQNGKKTMSGFASGLASQIPEVERQVNRARSVIGGLRVGGVAPTGSHAKGLAMVPYDGYVAELHKGERVLTAKEAQEYHDIFLAAMPTSYRTAGRDYSPMLESIRGALGGARGNVTNQATIQFYGDKPSPAKTARAVEKTMRRMLYGH